MIVPVEEMTISGICWTLRGFLLNIQFTNENKTKQNKTAN